MPVVDHQFLSSALHAPATVRVALPADDTDRHHERDKLPVLYLLHGRGDDHTSWTQHTGIADYAARYGLVVVMPAVGLSFYRNEVRGARYWDFLVDELPAVCAQQWPISTRRADTFVAGLSMGGYGAVQWALRRPGVFAAAASLSGQLDVAAVDPDDPADPGRRAIWERAFGPGSLRHTDADLLWLLANQPAGALPDLYVGCGLDDPLLAATETFAAAAARAGVPLTVDLSAGAHEWSFWDDAVRRVLSWLPLHR